MQPRRVEDSTAWADPNLIFSLTFRYLDDEAAKLAAKAKQEALKTLLGEVKMRLSDAKKEGQTFDCWVAGSEEISPNAARDDGRFISLRSVITVICPLYIRWTQKAMKR